jgi:hypothetical protein
MGYCKAVAFPSGPLRPLRLCGEVPGVSIHTNDQV